jgi:hypothetical protein
MTGTSIVTRKQDPREIFIIVLVWPNTATDDDVLERMEDCPVIDTGNQSAVSMLRWIKIRGLLTRIGN